MNDCNDSEYVNLFGCLRLEGLYDAIVSEVERLDIKFDGQNALEFKSCLEALNADALSLINAANGSGNSGLEFLDAPSSIGRTVSVEAKFYRFFFNSPSPDADWLHFVYLREK